MIKVYTLTIAFNDATEEVEYISEEVIDEEVDKKIDYGTLDLDSKEFWDSMSTDKMISIIKEIAES